MYTNNKRYEPGFPSLEKSGLSPPDGLAIAIANIKPSYGSFVPTPDPRVANF